MDEMRQRSKSAADTGALMELDDQFHSVLLRHCDNGRLVEMAPLGEQPSLSGQRVSRRHADAGHRAGDLLPYGHAPWGSGGGNALFVH